MEILLLYPRQWSDKYIIRSTISCRSSREMPALYVNSLGLLIVTALVVSLRLIQAQRKTCLGYGFTDVQCHHNASIYNVQRIQDPGCIQTKYCGRSHDWRRLDAGKGREPCESLYRLYSPYAIRLTKIIAHTGQADPPDALFDGYYVLRHSAQSDGQPVRWVHY